MPGRRRAPSRAATRARTASSASSSPSRSRPRPRSSSSGSPTSAASARSRRRAATPSIPWSREARMQPKILVVDDEEDLRDIVAFDLDRVGYAVVQAGCGKDAAALLERETVDLVLSDVRMPNGNGLSLLATVRA